MDLLETAPRLNADVLVGLGAPLPAIVSVTLSLGPPPEEPGNRPEHLVRSDEARDRFYAGNFAELMGMSTVSS